MSQLTDKLIDFDIMIESEPRREPSSKPGQIAEKTSALEESIFRLNAQLLSIKRTQKLSVPPLHQILSRHLRITVLLASTHVKTAGSQ
jgi:hypothetical protein